MAKLFSFQPTTVGPQVRAFRLEPENMEGFLTPHAHRFFEIVYFEESGGIHRLGDVTWESAAGDLLIIPPGHVHEWAEDVLEKQATIWILEFTVAALDPAESTEGPLLGMMLHPLLAPFAFGTEKSPLRLNVPMHRRNEWEASLRDLESERAAKEPCWEEAVHALFVLLLVQVSRLALDHDDNVVYAQSEPLLRKVFEEIDARFAESLSLSDVAEAVHYSPAYLTTTIRRLTGRTVGDWILWRRMAEARHLLLHTDDNISQIAEQVGYADPSHFNRLFRREEGSPPGAWRDANR
ncbi:MAG: AraC family transcriptional regulator [Rhodothermales bacterium]